MLVKKINILLLFVIVVSCKTVVVNKQTQKIAASALELGTIGTSRTNLQINAFEINAIPQLDQKIRVKAMVIPFNKGTFKAYSKSLKFQGKKSKIKYVDSLPNKPKFITLKIVDKITLLNELISEKNKTVLNYLKIEPKANIIIGISMVFDNHILSEITQADELYLSNVKYKKYELELYKNKKLHKTITLSKGTTFTYNLSSFCWSRNKRHEPILVNLNSGNSKCKNNTYNSYLDAKPKPQKIKF